MIDMPDSRPDDQWTLVRELTDEELTELRNKSIAWIKQYAPNMVRNVYDFTCEECPRKRICYLVYDTYNFDGDCLYDK